MRTVIGKIQLTFISKYLQMLIFSHPRNDDDAQKHALGA